MAFGLALMVGPWAGTLVLERFGGPVLWAVVSACGACAAGILAVTASAPTPDRQQRVQRVTWNNRV